MYELRGVTRRFRQGPSVIAAVDDIDLCVDEGELVAITGPSGSGKSTLLTLLGGLDRPTRGQVFFGAVDLARQSDRELTLLRRDAFGFIFQQFNLIPTLNALENVEAGIAPLAMKTLAMQEAARQLLEEVGLGDRARHLPSQLSGGEQQRVAIARALAKRPRVLLADEPTGNLDSKTGAEIMELIARSSERRGQTVVLVTHDAEASRYASRTIHMRDGRVGDAARANFPLATAL